MDRFRDELAEIDWDFERFSNINEKFKYFVSLIQRCFCSSFPVKTKVISHNHMYKPWITNAIKKSIKTKSKYFKQYRRCIISRETNDNFKNNTSDSNP